MSGHADSLLRFIDGARFARFKSAPVNRRRLDRRLAIELWPASARESECYRLKALVAG
jgi:hypothetical protein